VTVAVKRPVVTAVAVLSLALGIGANTAIFTVINAVFLHPLAIADPSSVVEMFTHDSRTVQGTASNLTPTSLQNYVDYRAGNAVFTDLAAFFPFGVQWTNNGAQTPIAAIMTSSNYFDVLGIRPIMGRLFTADEDLNHAVPVTILSYSLWTNRFGSDRTLIGRSITLNDMPFTVIGVTPQGFKGTATLAQPELLWVPLGMRDQLTTGQLKAFSTNRRFRWINILGRLKPGVTMGQARTGMSLIAASLERAYPDANRGHDRP
jgi:hypothetical protein